MFCESITKLLILDIWQCVLRKVKINSAKVGFANTAKSYKYNVDISRHKRVEWITLASFSHTASPIYGWLAVHQRLKLALSLLLLGCHHCKKKKDVIWQLSRIYIKMNAAGAKRCEYLIKAWIPSMSVVEFFFWEKSPATDRCSPSSVTCWCNTLSPAHHQQREKLSWIKGDYTHSLQIEKSTKLNNLAISCPKWSVAFLFYFVMLMIVSHYKY